MPAKKQPSKDGTLTGTYEFETGCDIVDSKDEINKFEGRLQGGGEGAPRGARASAEPKRSRPRPKPTVGAPHAHTSTLPGEHASDVAAVRDLDGFNNHVDSDSD